MRIFRNSACSIVFSLIIVSQLFDFPAYLGHVYNAMASKTADSIPVSEIQSPVNRYLFAIQVNNSANIIIEVHKLGVLIVNSNQIIPFDFDFRSFASYSLPTIYASPVPIFIRGHALLN